MDYILQTENLSKAYGDKLVLDNINLKIKAGSIFALIGENGAGKTSLLKILSGLAKASQGNVDYPTLDRSDDRPVMSLTLEEPGVIENMTAYENLKAKGILCGASEEEIRELLDRVSLTEAANKKVKKFSMGMKQRLAIALALLNKPSLVFFDEPINGLDPQGIKWFRDLVLDLNRDLGTTFIISSHILSELGLIASDFAFMHQGRLILTATGPQLNAYCQKNNISLENFYFNLLQNPFEGVDL